MIELPKIQTSNLFDQVYIALKHSILRRELGKNEKISIPLLAKQLGISITPIREALAKLEVEGLVRSVPKVGTFVVGIDRGYIEQIYDTRLMIDLWVLESYMRMPEDQLQQVVEKLSTIVQESAREIDTSIINTIEYSDYDAKFHSEIIRNAGNLKLLEIYLNLMTFRSLTTGLVTEDKYQTSMSQHQEIVEQMRSQNWDGARAVVRAHLGFSKHNLITWIDSNGGII